MYTSPNLKRCKHCGLDKGVSEFGPSKRHRDGLRPECRQCRRDIENARYASLTPDERAQRYERAVGRKVDVQRAVWEYLSEHPCADCGEPDPIVLEFDHVRGQKSDNVSRLIVNGQLDRVFEEIAKCDVVCRNCHTRRTAQQFAWYGRLEAVA